MDDNLDQEWSQISQRHKRYVYKSSKCTNVLLGTDFLKVLQHWDYLCSSSKFISKTCAHHPYVGRLDWFYSWLYLSVWHLSEISQSTNGRGWHKWQLVLPPLKENYMLLIRWGSITELGILLYDSRLFLILFCSTVIGYQSSSRCLYEGSQ